MKNKTCFSSVSVFMVCENASALHSSFVKNMSKAIRAVITVLLCNAIPVVYTLSYKVKNNEENTIKKMYN